MPDIGLELRQFNSDSFKASDGDSNHLSQILELWASFLPTTIPKDLTIDLRKKYLIESEFPWQIFYLVGLETQLVIATVMCVIKPSATKGQINILVEYVILHPEYRKKGIMNHLMNLVIGLYECVDDYDISQFQDKQKQDDLEQVKSEIIEFIKTRIYKHQNSFFWTLSSMVSEYYSKFGFKPHPRRIIYSKVVSNKAKNIKSFNLEKFECFIYDTDFRHFATSVEYSPAPLRKLKPNQVGASFESPSILEFNQRDKITFNYYKVPSKRRPPLGLVLKSEPRDGLKCQVSFVLVSLNFSLAPLMIHKLYTSVTDKKILVNHLKRINKFLDWVSFSLSTPDKSQKKLLDHVPNKNTVSLTTEEVVIEPGAIARKIVLAWLIKNGWKSAEDHMLLPMLKTIDTKQEVEWACDGPWCAF